MVPVSSLHNEEDTELNVLIEEELAEEQNEQPVEELDASLVGAI